MSVPGLQCIVIAASGGWNLVHSTWRQLSGTGTVWAHSPRRVPPKRGSYGRDGPGFRDLFDSDPAEDSEEYEAGYAARYREEQDSVSATAVWRAGCLEAERELTNLGTAAPEAGIGQELPLRIFGSGTLARKSGLPFDPFASETWKFDWVRADIALGPSNQSRRPCNASS